MTETDHGVRTIKRIVDAEHRARKLLDTMSCRLAELGLPIDGELPTVLMVGVGASNGWVADLHGKPTLFLALEMFPEPPYDAILVAHEALHLVHELARPRPVPETVAISVFNEGLATAVSRRLVSGHDLSEYLWFQDGYQDWSTICRRQWSAIWAQLAQVLDRPDDPSGRPFLRIISDQPADLPTRCGYYAGLHAAESLLNQPTAALRDVLRFAAETVTSFLKTFFTSEPPRF